MLLVWIVGAASSRDLYFRDKNDSRLEAAPTTVEKAVTQHQLLADLLSESVALGLAVGIVHWFFKNSCKKGGRHCTAAGSAPSFKSQIRLWWETGPFSAHSPLSAL